MKNFITTYKRNKLEDAKTQNKKLNCIDEAHQSQLENRMAKKYEHF